MGTFTSNWSPVASTTFSIVSWSWYCWPPLFCLVWPFFWVSTIIHEQIAVQPLWQLFFSGLVGALVNGPFETLTNRRQAGLRLPCTASARASVLMKGTLAALLRDAPGTQVYYHSYELSQLNGLNTFLCGAAAGACCTACAFPLDSIRAQLVTRQPIRLTFRGMGPIMVAQTLKAAVALKTYEVVATMIGFETSFNRTSV